jgi:hypothetical protein
VLAFVVLEATALAGCIGMLYPLAATLGGRASCGSRKQWRRPRSLL